MPTLERLCEIGHRPALVVSQPSRPRGRGGRTVDPPVVDTARRLGLEVAQEGDVRHPEFIRRIEAMQPWMAIVVAFGQIFPPDLLQIPIAGCVNLHASLLPRYRGAAPIQAALIAGETTTGVTTMLMDEGLDTGPILLQEELEIGQHETAVELGSRLAWLGAELVVRTVGEASRGTLQPRRQQAEGASMSRLLRRSDGEIDWNQSAQQIFNRLRGLQPWPGVFTFLAGEPVKILWGRPAGRSRSPNSRPGTIGGLEGDSLLIECGEDSLFAIETLQRSGRRKVSGRDFIHGERLTVGDRFD